jgi:hypothetical protein
MLLQPTRQASIRGNPSVALRRDQAKLTATPALLLSYFSAGQKAVANEAAAIASIPDDVFFTTKLVCRLGKAVCGRCVQVRTTDQDQRSHKRNRQCILTAQRHHNC